MARNRNKVYQQGDRINIYLSRDLTPEFVEWINKQSDLSNFFLYAAQQLYQQTGFIDVSEVMPRKINFEISSTDKVTLPIREQAIIEQPESTTKDEETIPVAKNESKEQESWAGTENLDDDPFA
jgi:hypothetical protein